MLRYSSRTHQKLMTESEYALQSASESPSPRVARIVSTMLNDSKVYRLWESSHADLLLPVAEQSRNLSQLMALRDAEVQLVHRRALFDYLRQRGLRGARRKQLFRLFHSTRDFEEAVLHEHRKYMIALSSHVSSDHLIDVMKDVNSKRLLRMYEKSYANYFDMRCFVALAPGSACVDLVRLSMQEAGEQLKRSRERIRTEAPVTDGRDFDREEELARSGRYPILNYMVG